ncbi:MAG: exodeoxyribonuclease VII large subunit [Acidimicrobiales bacterium]
MSSPAAAGRADVLTVLERSPLPLQVVEASAAMGGPRAAGEVGAALDILATTNVDLILVARGGGARSDLAPWDSVELAQAIARCPMPVWVALGHAGDRTVADRAAHRSHPTPSAAAGALVAAGEAVVHQEAQARSTREHQVQLANVQHRLRWVLTAAILAVLVLLLILL